MNSTSIVQSEWSVHRNIGKIYQCSVVYLLQITGTEKASFPVRSIASPKFLCTSINFYLLSMFTESHSSRALRRNETVGA